MQLKYDISYNGLKGNLNISIEILKMHGKWHQIWDLKGRIQNNTGNFFRIDSFIVLG